MKHAKRFVCLLLAMVMVFALGITAFAKGGSITVDNPIDSKTYTAYKIFDVVYDEKTVDGSSVAGDHYAYTISSTSDWFTTVQTYANDSTKGLTLTATANDATKYVVKATDAFSAPDFAKALQTALQTTGFNPTGGITLTKSGDTATATVTALGYYFVTNGDTDALCNLTTTDPNATIHDKNYIPFDKADDQESVDVGQTVNYTITGKVPDTTGFTSYTYEISDKMTKGLTPNLTVSDDGKVATGVTITIGSGTENKATDWTITPIYGTYGDDRTLTTENIVSTTPNAVVVGFTASIDMITAKYNYGDEIKVTYSATVNENAVAQIEKNHAVLTYSNDPADSTKTTPTTPDEETVYSAKIVIDKCEKKTDESATETKLSGAEFKLFRYALKSGDTYSYYKDDKTAYTETDATTANVVKLYYKFVAADTTAGTPAKVTWIEETDTAKGDTKTTNTNGAASFDGIADGTYYLLETKAPDGYNLLPEPKSVTVNGASATETTLGALTITEKVENETGGLLPSTGGIGTTVFYIIGGVLVIGAGVLLVVRRRMGKDD